MAFLLHFCFQWKSRKICFEFCLLGHLFCKLSHPPTIPYYNAFRPEKIFCLQASSRLLSGCIKRSNSFRHPFNCQKNRLCLKYGMARLWKPYVKIKTDFLYFYIPQKLKADNNNNKNPKWSNNKTKKLFVQNVKGIVYFNTCWCIFSLNIIWFKHRNFVRLIQMQFRDVIEAIW